MDSDRSNFSIRCMHIYTLKLVYKDQSWYCIQDFFIYFFFLEARAVGAKNPHSAYEALFETVRVIFPWLSYDSARIQLYILPPLETPGKCMQVMKEG